MHNRKISVLGLGYVGLPVAASFAEKGPVIGFDINANRINELQQGYDRTGELSAEKLKELTIKFSCNENDLKAADFHIVAVPTPVDTLNKPDFKFLKSASESVGRQLKKGDIVVYESTVYPGATEEVCLPILEKESGLKCPTDFSIGYSPERINPGDKEHDFKNIVKVVSGYDKKTLAIVAAVYGSVVTAGVHCADSIKIAEAAKVIENTQRDLNISLMNELAVLFDRLNIDTLKVLQAAETKWNFLPFRPGLVGGHCIGVDPYYLTHKAQEVNYHPEVILAGRRINDNMGKFIVSKLIKNLVHTGLPIKGAKIGVLGLTFKENCPDTRNSKVFNIIKELASYHVDILAHDPHAHLDEVHEEHGVKIGNWEEINDYTCLILAVAHKHYKDLHIDNFINKLVPNGILVDIKGILDPALLEQRNINYWRL